ncbi:tripartite tricarboxylate transporter substrate-binding protein [Ideonella sp. DXS29W]|uniref:Tripartite tricarboxylate transporter substrate-binding protein n=1 Tax=Ideonella lacteola TaxID=2984193 RepID=A0ABU9BYX9_9BURK
MIGTVQAAYPDKPVKVIVPFSPGAAADAVMRPLAAALSAKWGQQVLVENRPGLTVGPQAAAAAPADGYTLLFGAASTMVTTPLTTAKLPYDVQRDFVPVVRLATLPTVLVANPALGTKTLKDLLSLVRAKPGTVYYASSGRGAPNHLAMEYLLSLNGGDMVNVPYKGAAPAVVDLVGNQVQVAFMAVPSILPHVRSGRLLALAVGSSKRAAVLPQVPTVGETLPGFEYVAWYGLFAPAGTPAAVIDKVYADVVQAMETPKLREVLQAEGSEPATANGATLGRMIEQESQQWKGIIQQRKLSID